MVNLLYSSKFKRLDCNFETSLKKLFQFLNISVSCNKLFKICLFLSINLINKWKQKWMSVGFKPISISLLLSFTFSHHKPTFRCDLLQSHKAELTDVIFKSPCWPSWDAAPLLPQKHSWRNWKPVGMCDWFKSKLFFTLFFLIIVQKKVGAQKKE